jgi:hypothetical protein
MRGDLIGIDAFAAQEFARILILIVRAGSMPMVSNPAFASLLA